MVHKTLNKFLQHITIFEIMKNLRLTVGRIFFGKAYLLITKLIKRRMALAFSAMGNLLMKLLSSGGLLNSVVLKSFDRIIFIWYNEKTKKCTNIIIFGKNTDILIFRRCLYEEKRQR